MSRDVLSPKNVATGHLDAQLAGASLSRSVGLDWAQSHRGDAATLSLRDAQQRVASLKTPAQVLMLLATAERTGDDTLACAVAAYAWDRSWTQVLDAYAAERPGVLEKFHELDSLDGGQSVGGRMETDMAFRLLVPAERRGAHTEAALRKLATA